MARSDLDAVRRVAAQMRTVEARLATAFIRAQASGETLRDIGRAAGGMSHQRVERIIKKYSDASERPPKE